MVLPEARRLGGQRVDDDQELELGQRLARLVLVRERGNWVETLGDVAVDLAFMHAVGVVEYVVAVVPLGQPVEAPAVLGGGLFAPQALHQADEELRGVLVVVDLLGQLRAGRGLPEVGVDVGLAVGRQVHVARQALRQQAQVGIALDVGVPAQGVDAATGHADVAQQQLDHARATDHLGAGGVVGPAQGVEEGRGLVRGAGAGEDLANLQEVVFWRAAQFADHLRGVAADVLLEQVVHAAGVAQRQVTAGKALLIEFVGPGAAVVAAGLGVVATEQAVVEAVVTAHDQAGIGVGAHVVVLDAVMADQVIDHAHEEGDVGASADRRVQIGDRSAAVEARVDDDDLGSVADLRLDHPLEAHRVGLGRVAAHDQHNVGVLDVDPVVGHRATAKGRRQRGHGRGMADPGLAVGAEDAQGAGEALVQRASLAAGRG
ncbi:hypothetical protein D3C81_509300 [compost metagenome]